ncbi:MAG: ABC transporter permease, partial [Oscillospiraceae bacterium]
TQVLHSWLGTDTITLPLPSRIGEIISSNSASIGEQVKITVLVALGGLAAGSILGYLIAVIATVFSKWGAGGLTIVSAFNAIPIVALAPVINNWTRDISNEVSIRSTIAKIIVVTISCTAAMSVNAFRGLTELKPFSEDLMKSYAASKLTVFLKLRLPNSLPYVFTALRVSVPASVIGALVTEYFAEDTVGVGRQIRENIVKGQYPTAWAYIAVACAIGIIMYIILMFIERITLKRRRT